MEDDEFSLAIQVAIAAVLFALCFVWLGERAFLGLIPAIGVAPLGYFWHVRFGAGGPQRGGVLRRFSDLPLYLAYSAGLIPGQQWRHLVPDPHFPHHTRPTGNDLALNCLAVAAVEVLAMTLLFRGVASYTFVTGSSAALIAMALAMAAVSLVLVVEAWISDRSPRLVDIAYASVVAAIVSGWHHLI